MSLQWEHRVRQLRLGLCLQMVSAAAQQLPEEVYRPAAQGEPQADGERQRDQRRTRRRAHKSAHKKRTAQQAVSTALQASIALVLERSSSCTSQA